MNKKYFLGTETASNNTGELSAICEGLLWLKDHEKSNKSVAFYYDSKYASKITTGEYKANENKHLAATARALLKLVMENRKVRFEHVKGHSNDRWNDKADELADLGATGKQCIIGRYTQTQTQQENNTEETKNTNKKTETSNKQREDIRKINDQRLTSIRIQEKDKIHIPKPTYGKGSNIRSKFAFGKISKEQAKFNTARRNKEQQEKTQNSDITEQHETQEDNTTNTPMINEDLILQERIRQEEEEEEDIFYGDDNPNPEDCA